MEVKERRIGVYGVIIKDKKIALVRKASPEFFVKNMDKIIVL